MGSTPPLTPPGIGEEIIMRGSSDNPHPAHPLQAPMKMGRSPLSPACGSPEPWIPRALDASTSCPSKWGLWKGQAGEEGFATEGGGRPFGTRGWGLACQ